MKCIFCNKSKLKTKFSVEHIIPESLGNKDLTINICKECNSKLGSYVDQVMSNSSIIKMYRANAGLRESNGRPIKVLNSTEYDANKNKYLTRGNRIIPVNQDYSSKRFEILKFISFDEIFNYNYEIIKIAYEYGYYVFGERYLQTALAKYYRRILLNKLYMKRSVDIGKRYVKQNILIPKTDIQKCLKAYSDNIPIRHIVRIVKKRNKVICSIRLFDCDALTYFVDLIDEDFEVEPYCKMTIIFSNGRSADFK